jgi:hypothetical protein
MLRAEKQGFDFWQRQEIASRSAIGPTQLLIQCVPGVKLLEREADHSSVSSAEVKNGGTIPAFSI